MSESSTTQITIDAAQLNEFHHTLDALKAAFEDWATIKGIDAPYMYEFQSIDETTATFGYIKWGYEPRYDGWEEFEEQMPLEFLTDPSYRDRLIAEETAKREQAEREKAEAERAAAEKKRQEKEQRDRAELARLLETYPDEAAALIKESK